MRPQSTITLSTDDLLTLLDKAWALGWRDAEEFRYSRRHRVVTRETFWQRVDKSGKCWLWTGTTIGKGYGTVHWRGRAILTHRLAWLLTHDDVPSNFDELLVCHNCPGGDNPLCCNPDHLFLGTIRDNNRDMMKKGRMYVLPPRQTLGEAHPQAKLTDTAVRLIRERHATGIVSQRALAREFGVSEGTISDIIRRNHWTHIA